MPFQFQRLSIPDVVAITPKVFPDARGFFIEVFKQPDLASFGITEACVQINHSRSQKGVVRGLHYQLHPAAQSKIVRVLSGKIYDVAVDIRRGSPFYGKWVGLELSAEDHKMIYIPVGFAHGFAVISDQAEIEYLCSKIYAPELERGICYNDPELKITWPVNDPVVSGRDHGLPPFRGSENNFIYDT